MRKSGAIIGAAILLTGCIRTQEMPLAPNVVRLDTQASGILFAGQASSATMKRAAELTLQNGFTHFRFDQPQISQGTQLSGVYTSSQASGVGSATATRMGNTVFVNGGGSASGSSFATPIYRPTSSVGVTVYMYRADEPAAQGAFDAAEVLHRMAS